MANARRSREEILELFRTCQAKLGETPGMGRFCKMTGLKKSEVDYYWPRTSALVREAGAEPKEFITRYPDDEVFEDYARLCVHLRKIPTKHELRIAARDFKTKTSTVYQRHGSIEEFQSRFRKWLENAKDDFKPILQYDGWRLPKTENQPLTIERSGQVSPYLHPFLPGALQYLDILARGEIPPYEAPGLVASTLFERRTADAFRCLGFEIQSLGQGTGRNPDVIALARRERFAVIIDAKVRINGYTLGTEDRKFLEYAVNHGKELQRQGIDKIYLVVVGSSFREGDLKKLTETLSESPVRSVDMITASALMRMVEESIKDRALFLLSDFDRKLFGNKIISA